MASRGYLDLKVLRKVCRPREKGRGEFMPWQTRQLPRAVDLKGLFLFLVVVKC
jgi:hypothetical protein